MMQELKHILEQAKHRGNLCGPVGTFWIFFGLRLPLGGALRPQEGQSSPNIFQQTGLGTTKRARGATFGGPAATSVGCCGRPGPFWWCCGTCSPEMA